MSEGNPFDLREFRPPGPVCRAFITDFTSLSPFIMGPVGSGKTNGIVWKRYAFAMRMPICPDGVVRCKWIALREDGRTLEKTLLQTWLRWFPRGMAGSEWSGGNDRPATHVLTMRFRRKLADGSTALVPHEIITEFRGVNGARADQVFQGWEGTGGLLNEATLIDREIPAYLRGRLGRYPPQLAQDQRDAVTYQITGDLNAPDIGHWIYEDFVEHPTAGRKLYIQPGGRSPAAENVQNLPSDYYATLVAENPAWWVRRFVDNQFGYSRDGKPVFEEFDQDRHIAAKDFDPDPDLPVIVGLDADLTPAAVFLQPLPTGQIRVLDEVSPGHGFGPLRFAELLITMIAMRYGRCRLTFYADPSSQYGGDQEGGMLSWMETMQRALEAPILIPGNGSNELGPRLDVVRQQLIRTIDGRVPGIILNPVRCRGLIKGFASEYRYAMSPVSRQFTDKPEKNGASHPQDALQYALLGWFGRSFVVSESARAGRPRDMMGRAQRSTAAARPQGDFDVHRF